MGAVSLGRGSASGGRTTVLASLAYALPPLGPHRPGIPGDPMESIWTRLGEGLVTIGPVGFFILACVALYLYIDRRYPKQVQVGPRDPEPPKPAPTGPSNGVASLSEARMEIHDTRESVRRIEHNTDEEIQHLSSLIAATARLQETEAESGTRLASAQADSTTRIASALDRLDANIQRRFDDLQRQLADAHRREARARTARRKT